MDVNVQRSTLSIQHSCTGLAAEWGKATQNPIGGSGDFSRRGQVKRVANPGRA